jgi:hypothetical protein
MPVLITYRNHKVIFPPVVVGLKIESSGLFQFQVKLSVSIGGIFRIKGNIGRFSSHAQLLRTRIRIHRVFCRFPSKAHVSRNFDV